MKNLIAILLAVLCCALCRAQDPNTTIEQNSTLTQTLPWSSIQTKDFSHPSGEDIATHIRNHPMLGDELEKLHEWLHQKIERLRPNGARSFIVVESTEAEFLSWSNRRTFEQVGWRIVHVPARVAGRIRSVVALDKTHYSYSGFVTSDFLNRCNTQFQNRQIRPVKNARARFVKSVKMMTRANCSWCEKWKASDYGQAIADGVAVDLVTDQNGTVPRFEVCDSEGRCRQYVGYKSYQDMKRDVQ
jgi:hypothetical protein